jgi:hypothetical protein
MEVREHLKSDRDKAMRRRPAVLRFYVPRSKVEGAPASRRPSAKLYCYTASAWQRRR